MKRRKFIKLAGGSSLAATALSTMPTLLQAQTEAPNYTLFTGEVIGGGNNYSTAVKIVLDTLKDLKGASNENKTVIIGFKIDNDYTQKVSHQFTIKKVKVLAAEPAKYEVELKNGNVIEGESKHTPDTFPKKVKLIVEPASKLTITDKKGNEYLSLDKYIVPATGPTCFVTAACVMAKQLPDNCEELSILRTLRENYMRGTTFGDVRIEAYNQIGPQVVAAINKRQNANEIYDSIYEHLITPSIQLIENKQYEKAMYFYGDYVLGLHELLEN